MYEDPEKLRKRRITVFSILGVILAVLMITGVSHLTHYQRTSSKEQMSLMGSTEPTVVMFYSTKCPDCKKVTLPIKKAITGQKFKSVTNSGSSNQPVSHTNTFVEWQNKQDKSLFKKYQVQSVPTFMVFKQGIPQQFIVNGQPTTVYSGTDPNVIKQIYTNLQVK